MNRRVQIPANWIAYLRQQPESGMDYQVVAVTLKDGRRFNQVVTTQGHFTQVRGYRDVPFDTEDVASVEINHERWNFREE
jgi:hypothetical protein